MIAQQKVAGFQAFVAPVIALNKIALGYAERAVELNLAVLRKQAEVVLAGWRDALAVKDPEQVKDYLARQGEVARNVVNGYVADATAVTELNRQVANDVRKVVETSFAGAARQAA